MIQHPAFRVEPWSLHETELHLDVLAQTESLFALSNGHIGLRGNLDEGEPPGLPGTYLNGFFEQHPLPYAEAGYGAQLRTAHPAAPASSVNQGRGHTLWKYWKWRGTLSSDDRTRTREIEKPEY